MQNLQAKLPGASARLQSVRWLTLPERDSKALGRFSHIVRVRLEKLPEEADSQLTLALPAPGIPTWVTKWSTTDDNSPGPNANTYRLTDVLGGVRGAFPIILPNVFTTTIALSNR